MILCQAQRIAYIAPPKTGTETIAAILESPPFNGKAQSMHTTRHPTTWQPRFQNWFIFMTTRHPYTRAVSHWKFTQRRIQRELNSGGKPHNARNTRNLKRLAQSFNHTIPTFLEFLTHPERKLRITVWRNSWHLEQIPRPIDKIVHQENLEAEFKSIPAFSNCEMGRPRHKAPASSIPWYEEYTPELIAQVQDMWGQDFAAFGYNPDFDACVRGEYFTDSSVG